MKRVILCVDDFGLKPEVNEAVAELADAGVVSATGCMSQGPAWREGAGLLKGERRHRLELRGERLGQDAERAVRQLDRSAAPRQRLEQRRQFRRDAPEVHRGGEFEPVDAAGDVPGHAAGGPIAASGDLDCPARGRQL